MMHNPLFWTLPHNTRRSVYKLTNPTSYNELNAYRKRETHKLTAQTFKPFLDTKTLFVHIPKTAGIAVGHAVYGRHTGNHTTIAQYKLAFSKAEFNSFFRFTFVRNPWDRVLSAYLFLKHGGRNAGDALWAEQNLSAFGDFKTFVKEWVTEQNVQTGIHFKPQIDFLTTPESPKLQVDFVGRFETLAADWATLKSKINTIGNLETVNVNPAKTKDYRQAYCIETTEILSRVYAKDIAQFGYTFG